MTDRRSFLKTLVGAFLARKLPLEAATKLMAAAPVVKPLTFAHKTYGLGCIITREMVEDGAMYGTFSRDFAAALANAYPVRYLDGWTVSKNDVSNAIIDGETIIVESFNLVPEDVS